MDLGIPPLKIRNLLGPKALKFQILSSWGGRRKTLSRDSGCCALVYVVVFEAIAAMDDIVGSSFGVDCRSCRGFSELAGPRLDGKGHRFQNSP